MQRTALFAAVLLLTACAAATPAPSPAEPFFPQHGSPLGIGDAALLQGELVSVDACLWVRTGDGSGYLVLWPSDTTLVAVDGLATVIGPQGEPLAQAGSSVSLGGSQTDARIAEQLVGPIPERCAGRAFWVVSTVDPVR